MELLGGLAMGERVVINGNLRPRAPCVVGHVSRTEPRISPVPPLTRNGSRTPYSLQIAGRLEPQSPRRKKEKAHHDH